MRMCLIMSNFSAGGQPCARPCRIVRVPVASIPVTGGMRARILAIQESNIKRGRQAIPMQAVRRSCSLPGRISQVGDVDVLGVGMSWRRSSSSVTGAPDRDPPEQPPSLSFSPLRLQFPGLMGSQRRWSRSSDLRASNVSQPAPNVNAASGSPGGSPTSSSDDDDSFTSNARWPLGFDQFDWEGSPSREASSYPPSQPSPSRPQRAANFGSSFPESDYPLSDFPVRRSDADARGPPSRSSWFSQRRTSLPQTNGSGGGDPYNYLYLNLTSPEFPSPTDSMRRNSATSEHTDSWRGLSTAAHLADMPEFERSAERSRSLGRDRRPRLHASSPPRGSFTLPTPDFSPVFDSFPERMESSPPVSPHGGGAHTYSGFGQLGSHADLHHFHRVIRPPTPPPPPSVWEARPRQPSPHRLPMPETNSNSTNSTTTTTMTTTTLPRNSAVYRNLHDLSAYQDSSFRASLQRFIELDSVRSRLSRLESMAAGEMEGGRHQPPSLPPLRFESEMSAPQSEPTVSGSVVTRVFVADDR